MSRILGFFCAVFCFAYPIYSLFKEIPLFKRSLIPSILEYFPAMASLFLFTTFKKSILTATRKSFLASLLSEQFPSFEVYRESRSVRNLHRKSDLLKKCGRSKAFHSIPSCFISSCAMAVAMRSAVGL